MLVAGKSSPGAWLTLPTSAYLPWAKLNGVDFRGIDVSVLAADETRNLEHVAESSAEVSQKGGGLVATTVLDSASKEPILTVPCDLVLSESRIRQIASGDARLAELLKACEALVTSSRITIIIFLLYQATVANPDVTGRFGNHTPFIEYLKFLPIPRASTLFNDDEISLFDGTTLVPATAAKLRKLNREFAALRQYTEGVAWIASTWWNLKDEETSMVAVEDWILLDAMYRSRALEWPGQGEAMVPLLDMANHTIPANATFDVTSDAQGVLVLQDDVRLQPQDEVFISYGNQKTPLEILFSYGFMPNYTDFAGSILLTLPPLDDNDPLAPPKAAMASKENVVPGIRIYEHVDGVSWDSELLWLIIVNEEDGLGFRVVYGPGGQRDLDMFWHDQKVAVLDFKNHVKQDRMCDLLTLRASVIVLQQIEHQLQELEDTNLDFEAAAASDLEESLVEAARKLRTMEEGLLLSARDAIEQQKRDLVMSPTVQEYFASIRAREIVEEEEEEEEEEDVVAETPEDDFT